jgi:IS5 family transposase
MRPGKRRALASNGWGALLEQAEKLKASVRAKVECPFRVIKCQFGHTNVRYRRLKKNTAQLVSLFALSNLWIVRKRILQGLAVQYKAKSPANSTQFSLCEHLDLNRCLGGGCADHP